MINEIWNTTCYFITIISILFLFRTIIMQCKSVRVIFQAILKLSKLSYYINYYVSEYGRKDLS